MNLDDKLTPGKHWIEATYKGIEDEEMTVAQAIDQIVPVGILTVGVLPIFLIVTLALMSFPALGGSTKTGTNVSAFGSVSAFRCFHSGFSHLKQHVVVDGGVCCDSGEGQEVQYDIPFSSYFFSILGLVLEFYGLWNLKLGPQNWLGFLALIIGLLAFGYGFNLFLDSQEVRGEPAHFGEKFVAELSPSALVNWSQGSPCQSFCGCHRRSTSVSAQ